MLNLQPPVEIKERVEVPMYEYFLYESERFEKNLKTLVKQYDMRTPVMFEVAIRGVIDLMESHAELLSILAQQEFARGTEAGARDTPTSTDVTGQEQSSDPKQASDTPFEKQTTFHVPV